MDNNITNRNNTPIELLEFETTFAKKYPKRLNQLEALRVLAGVRTLEWSSLTDLLLITYKDHLLSRLCNNSVSVHCAELRALLNEYYKIVEFPSKQYERILTLKKESTQSVYLTPKEIERIETWKPKSDMYRNIVALWLKSYYTGARLEDAKKLSRKNINSENSVLSYVPEKTKKAGTIVKQPLHSKLLNVIDVDTSAEKYNSALVIKYMTRLCKWLGIDDEVALFRAGKHVVKKKYELITAHTARRSFATNMYLCGVEVSVIKRYMGHNQIETTEGYILEDRTPNEKVLNFFGR